jgi:hypothetical protein
MLKITVVPRDFENAENQLCQNHHSLPHALRRGFCMNHKLKLERGQKFLTAEIMEEAFCRLYLKRMLRRLTNEGASKS